MLRMKLVRWVRRVREWRDHVDRMTDARFAKAVKYSEPNNVSTTEKR